MTDADRLFDEIEKSFNDAVVSTGLLKTALARHPDVVVALNTLTDSVGSLKYVVAAIRKATELKDQGNGL